MLQIAPHRYYSASGALQSLGGSLEPLGERAFVIANKTVLERFEDVVRESLKESMIGVNFEVCLGECCRREVDRLTDEADEDDADIVVGIGAGKSLDVAKHVAHKLESRTVTVPSVASSHAAYSNLIYLYNEEGDFLRVKELETAPDLTVVDYKIVGLAPSRYLQAGMGMAIATSYDFDVSREELETHQPTKIAYELGGHLRDSLFENGARALEDVKKGEVTGRVETLIEMVILESGLISSLGGRNFRSRIAHQLARQLDPYTSNETLYGEVVAYGLLVQELYQGDRASGLTDLLDWYRETELPLTLDSLGLPENQRDSILDDALGALQSQLNNSNLSFEISRDRLDEAIGEANSLGKRVIQSGVEDLE